MIFLERSRSCALLFCLARCGKSVVIGAVFEEGDRCRKCGEPVCYECIEKGRYAKGTTCPCVKAGIWIDCNPLYGTVSDPALHNGLCISCFEEEHSKQIDLVLESLTLTQLMTRVSHLQLKEEAKAKP